MALRKRKNSEDNLCTSIKTPKKFYANGKRKPLKDIFFTDLMFLGCRGHSSSKGSASLLLVNCVSIPSEMLRLLSEFVLSALMLLLLSKLLPSRPFLVVVVVVVVTTTTFGT